MAKLKSGGASYDIIIPSDYMVARMIAEDMVQPLDFDNIPNVRFLDEQYLYTDFDPEGAYSVRTPGGLSALSTTPSM